MSTELSSQRALFREQIEIPEELNTDFNLDRWIVNHDKVTLIYDYIYLLGC